MQGNYQKVWFTGARTFSNHAPLKTGFRPVETEGAKVEEERKMLVNFFRHASEQSMRARFHRPMSAVMRAAYAEQLLGKARDREAIVHVAESEASDVIGVGEAHRIEGSNDAEISVMVDDEYRRCGVGSKLVEMVENESRQENVDRMMAHLQESNPQAKQFFRAKGYQYDPATENWTKKL